MHVTEGDRLQLRVWRPAGIDKAAVAGLDGDLERGPYMNQLRAAIPLMRPTDDIAQGPGRWCLADEAVGCLIYSATDGPLSIDLTRLPGRLVVRWIDPGTGETTQSGELTSGRRVDIQSPLSAPSVLWLSRD